MHADSNSTSSVRDVKDFTLPTTVQQPSLSLSSTLPGAFPIPSVDIRQP